MAEIFIGLEIKPEDCKLASVGEGLFRISQFHASLSINFMCLRSLSFRVDHFDEKKFLISET